MFRLFTVLHIMFLSQALFAQDSDKSHSIVKISQQQWEQSYITKPNVVDTTCILAINKAKTDIANGKIVFTHDYGFLFGDIRYENELRQLCRKKGLIFDYDLISDVVIEGQTEGCYGAYMDKVIAAKFGSNFKAFLHKKADSLFLLKTTKNNRTVQYWDCDERPRLPKEKKRSTDDLPIIHIDKLAIVESDSGSGPFFDLGFIVEKDSTVSNFHIRSWVPRAKTNEKFKPMLYEIAVDYIETKYPKWVPGKVLGVPVRTDNNVRIYFVKD